MATYTRVNWANKQAGGTKLGATNLNVMDKGIDDLYDLYATAGGLVVAQATGTPIALPIGSNDEVLSVNSGALDYRKVAAAMIDASGSDDDVLILDSGEASGLKYGPTIQTYTPALTATTTPPTLGTGGSTAGRFIRIGDIAFVWMKVTFGTSGTNAGSGTYLLSLPVTATTGILQFGGGIWSHDTTDSSVDIILSTSTTVAMRRRALTSGEDVFVQHNSPHAWDASDTFNGFIVVEIA